MKKILSALFVFAVALSASAQITYNAKASLGLASVAVSGTESDVESKFVGKIGGGIEKPLNENWALMPSLELAWKGYKVEGAEDVNFMYVQVPVLAAYRLNLNDSWNMTAKAGPYFAYALSGDSGDDELGDFFDNGGKRFDAGIILAVDFEYHKYVIGVEYERGLTNIYDEAGISVTNQAFYATIGYKF